MSQSLPRVIAHRGASAYAPENTLAAMHKAHELGVRWVEFDVKLSADGVAVIVHDESVKRTSNGRGNVADLSLAALKQLDAGSWFADEYAGERIPTLQEMIGCLNELDLSANIEIKPSPGLEIETTRQTYTDIQHYWRKQKSPPLLSSFSLKAMREMRQLDAQIPLGLLLDHWDADWQALADELACVSVHIPRRLLNKRRAQAIKQSGCILLVYTIDSGPVAEKFFAWGVDGVFSNAPDKIQAVLSS